MLTSLRDYFSNLRFAEKLHFDNGDLVKFTFGNNLADLQWQYSAFLPKDSEDVVLYRWNPFFPEGTQVSEKLDADEDSALAQEFIRKIGRHEIVPYIYVG